MRRSVLLLVALVLVPGCVSDDASRGDIDARVFDADSARVEFGYLEGHDGTLLSYAAKVPGDGRFPVLLRYDAYNVSSPDFGAWADRYVAQGYVVLGVNVRGTGCSAGAYDIFSRDEARDGASSVEWAADQNWSNGRVGMVHKSYPGITQLFVAQERPRGLVAIAPGHFLGDLYRDVVYPGGVPNVAFASAWSTLVQPNASADAARARAERDDTCRAHLAARHENAPTQPLARFIAEPLDGPLYRERSPITNASAIDVPLLTVLSWQDEQLPARGSYLLERLSTPWWAILTNGDHDMWGEAAYLDVQDDFFDRFVRGVDNGFEARPRVTVWWETRADSRDASWTTEHDAWPAPASAWTLNLTPDMMLVEAPPQPGTTSWLYAPGASSANDPGHGVLPPDAGGALSRSSAAPSRVAWRTAPLDRDVAVLGSANVTLHVSTLAPDVDVQVSLREVRGGETVHVQRGWLRATHRALDAENSTPFRPLHPHAAEETLPPGGVVALHVEVFPFAHVFRSGTQIELLIEAPGMLPELWGFAPRPGPALVLVHHDAAATSSVTLPIVDITPRAPLPACGALLRQACVG